MSKYKCPFDDATFKTSKELIMYVEKKYIDKIPHKYNGDVAHFLYDLRNKPGRCQICGTYTQWNSKYQRYDILCSIPKTKNLIKKAGGIFKFIRSYFKNKGNTCKQVMRKIYLNNIKRTHGTDNLMDDPEYQKKLLEHRKITATAKFRRRTYTTVGKYETLFVNKLNDVNDNITLEMPGPTIHINKEDITYTIPDAYIPEYNLIISIKDMGDIPQYQNNYNKACVVFEHVYNHTDMNIIELNGIEQINNIEKYLELYKKDKLPIGIQMPIYMKKVRPDLYEKIIKHK